MRPRQLLLRCYAERNGDLWVAYCLDFTLACQGDTLKEVKAKLDAQIRDYVYDALVGEDREHAEYLLTRRAPARYWLTYWYIRAVGVIARALHLARQPSARPFHEVMPVAPATC